jgi:hypothetical protein
MADVTPVILDAIGRQWTQAIQTETHRSNVTNYLLVISSAFQGLIVNNHFDRPTLFLAFLIIVFGVLGIVITLKYYERFRLCMMRYGKYIDALNKIHENSPKFCYVQDKRENDIYALIEDMRGIWAIQYEDDKAHKEKFNSFIDKTDLHKLWVIIHVIIVVLGVIDILIILQKNNIFNIL